MSAQAAARLVEQLWPAGDDGCAWALLDGARDPRVYELVVGSELAYRCLYVGELHPALARAAPYLVRLARDAPFTRALLAEGFGRSWGIFARSPASLGELHRHFRRFLRVRTEQGRTLLFRYYDPRVFRVYLPTCTAAELGYVFGPVASYVLEGDAADTVLTFRPGAGQLVREAIRVERPLAWLGEYLRASRVEEPEPR